jgi:hypothetical protein
VKKLVFILAINLFACSLSAQLTDSSSSFNGSSNRYNHQRSCPYCHQPINSQNSSYTCNSPVSNAVFNAELLRLKHQNSAAGKKLVAKRIADSYCLTAKQVFELCNNMFLNTDKLEMAKFCYANCIDPENYEIVYNAFPAGALINELHDFIAGLIWNNLGNGGWRNQYEQRPCKLPMSAQNFESAKKTIKSADFDNSRMETAATIITNNCLSTDQVIEICKMFSFEQNKLDFAKLAWSHTYDQSNYFKVSSVFDYSSSKELLNKFIQEGGK